MFRACQCLLRLTILLTLTTTLAIPCLSSGLTGTISGKVLDQQGNPLPGAAVWLEGTALATRSGRSGDYRLVDVPSGTAKISVAYLGHEPRTVELEVSPGALAIADVALKRATYDESITVRSEPLLQGQAKALNQQKSALHITNVVSADQIGRFPDPNAAEATQRLPGITLQRDQGEGRFVIIRGTETRLSSMTINGERIPSPEGGGREVPLDVVPADLLQAIEVSKTLTPAMDGDAIGGAVNLVTKLAPEKTRVSGSVSAGHNDLSDEPIKSGNVSYGSRFGSDGALGVLVSGSVLETDRATHNFESKYDEGELEELEFRSYEIERQRSGLTASADYQGSDRSHLFFRGLWNRYSDQEDRRKKESRLDKGRIDREYKDRYESQKIHSASLGGEHLFGHRFLLAFSTGYSRAEEHEPDRFETKFRQKKVSFAPNVSPDQIDPDNIRANPLNEDLERFKFDVLERENNSVAEEDLFGKVDFRRPFYRGTHLNGLFSFGGKVRLKDKYREQHRLLYESEGDLFLVDFLQPLWQPADPFFAGRYEIGSFSSPETPESLLPILEAELDPEADLGDYDAEEDNLAVYGMGELHLGNRLTLLGGVRYESTESRYRAFELLFDEEGDFVSRSPLSGSSRNDEWLPSAHLRFGLDDHSNFRAAVSRSLARPNFGEVAPFRLIEREDAEIFLGNPELRWTTAWNLDFLYERFFNSVGLVSAGVFYKDLSDTIFLFTTDQIVDGTPFEVTQPQNGGDGEILGFEVALERKLRFLPKPFDGLGLYLNYTHADSQATLLDRTLDQLPGQAEHVANFALSYEKRGFSGRISWNYYSSYQFLEVGEEPEEDFFIDDRSQLDLALQQRVSRRVALSLELVNLTNERYRVYEGVPSRPVQEDIYKAWGTLGIKIDI